MSNRRTANFHSILLFKNETDDDNNHTENNIEFLEGETSVEPKTNPTENTQQNLMQIPNSSHSEIFTKQVQTSSVEFRQNFLEVFSSEQTQAEAERLRIQHQRRIQAANQLSLKPELERNQFLQQKNQLDTEIQLDSFAPESIKMIPSTSKRYHHNKLQDLNFQFLHHSSFMSLQKYKNELLLRMLSAHLKILYIIQQDFCRSKITVMIFTQSL